MGIAELFLIALGLSMDAFAAAVCKGMTSGGVKIGRAALVGLYFGVFQAGMPLAGYFLGSTFADGIRALDHWVAFGLLVLIGAGMIRESIKSKNEECDTSLSFRVMLPLAIATSIDALAAGLSFALLEVDIYFAVLFIGVTTFVLSAAATMAGALIGNRCKKAAEIVGGSILIIMGFKILLEHLSAG